MKMSHFLFALLSWVPLYLRLHSLSSPFFPKTFSFFLRDTGTRTQDRFIECTQGNLIRCGKHREKAETKAIRFLPKCVRRMASSSGMSSGGAGAPLLPASDCHYYRNTISTSQTFLLLLHQRLLLLLLLQISTYLTLCYVFPFSLLPFPKDKREKTGYIISLLLHEHGTLNVGVCKAQFLFARRRRPYARY